MPSTLTESDRHAIVEMGMTHLRLLHQVGFSKAVRINFVDNMFKRLPAATFLADYKMSRGAPLNAGFVLRCVANLPDEPIPSIEGTLYAACFWSKTYAACKFMFEGAPHPLMELLTRIRDFAMLGRGTTDQYKVCASELICISNSLSECSSILPKEMTTLLGDISARLVSICFISQLVDRMNKPGVAAAETPATPAAPASTSCSCETCH